ncbi:MAG: 4Fe-4S binding protein [Polyangiaceae bacterium]|nr:4Fe-4S binding protein [Polyangiaceae bacterium]
MARRALTFQAIQACARDMMSELGAITHRIADLQPAGAGAPPRLERAPTAPGQRDAGTSRVIARIDKTRCTACWLCVDLCPEQAISMRDAITVDSTRCAGCGKCAEECPNEAISMSDVGLARSGAEPQGT